MSIHRLSEQLASQIAAGEVVERPASVVKELVENALDAGASQINVDVRQGGRALIQVADDGAGIPADEVELAFQRHATSKLASVEDLNAIGTLGFRGEALAAIAAVSQLTVVTRTAGEAAGSRLVLHGGVIQRREAVGAPQGTVLAVENLFFNVPARLKFLKSMAAEKRQIDEFISRYALAYPAVRFRLTHNGRITFETPGQGALEEALVAVYGPDVARQLLPVATPTAAAGRGADGAQTGAVGPDTRSPDRIRVQGFVGPPSLHWANRSHIVLFVNGRWVRDNQLTYAVIQAYHTLLPTGRYPLALLFLAVPLDQVDVNVHPTKTEIRFRQGVSAFGLVQRAVRETLVASSPVRLAGLPGPAPAEAWSAWAGELDQAAFRQQEAWSMQPVLAWARPEGDSTATAGDRPLEDGPPLTPRPVGNELGGERLPLMRVVGQVGAAYIIAEGPDGLFLIDQHAAHERVLYEQFLAAWDDQTGLATQGLLNSAVVHLTPAQASLVDEHRDTLARLGFQVEVFGPHSFVLRAVPAIVAGIDPERALRDVVADLEQGERPLQGPIEARIVRRVCKTAAVKAGQTLGQPEMEALIRRLEACQSPHTCPHGRPTLIHISVGQLARQFGRLA